MKFMNTIIIVVRNTGIIDSWFDVYGIWIAVRRLSG